MFLSAISYRELIRSNKVIDEIGKASGQTWKRMLELSHLLLSSIDKSMDTDRNQSTDEENKGPKATSGRFLHL